MKIFKYLLLIMLLTVVIIGGSIIGIMAGYSKHLPDIGKISEYFPAQTTKIYSEDNKLLANIYTENRTVIPLSNVPNDLKFAIIATEDARFYEHTGIDLFSICRALYTNIKEKRIVQGGSTITQQLARSLFLSRERTITRKIQEILLALEIEKRYSKDEILEMYLNQIYFGEGAYGIEAAAQVYFGKPAKELNLAEAALLAGLPAAPARYSPYANYELAKRRQERILDKMYELGFIQEEEREKAKNMKLEFKKVTSRIIKEAPYFVIYVLKLLEEEFGKDMIYNGGLQIHTTLCSRMQEAAEEALAKWMKIARREKLNINQAALIAMDVKTGYIKALVGGVNFKESQFNRAVQAKRQPGSAFKPFVYLAALKNGYTPYSRINDSPITFRVAGEDWTPHNFDHRFRGPITLKHALQWSINVPAVKVCYDISPEVVVEYAYKLGLESVHPKRDLTYSLALGGLTYGVTLLEMARAFSVFANGGVKCQPISIKRVTYADGRVLKEARIERVAVISPEAAHTINYMLNAAIAAGTGRRAYIGGACAGKTGTTSDFRDAWFIGYTPDLCVAVWVGNDDNTPTRKVCGGYIPAAIWREFMVKVLGGNKPAGEFKPLPKEALLKKEKRKLKDKEKEAVEVVTDEKKIEKEEVEIEVCALSEKLATGYCPNIISKRVRRERVPRVACDIHSSKKKVDLPVQEETLHREDLIEVDICRVVGKLANEYCPAVITKELPKDRIPFEVCNLHGPSE